MNKLLQINATANIGSTGRISENIGQCAISAGFESYIAYGRGANESKSNLIRIGNKLQLATHLMNTRLFDAHGLGSRSATIRLIKKIDTIKPNIIQLHNLHGYYLNYEILFEYLQKINVPVVWTLHDCWAFTGHCSHFEFAGCTKWKSGCHHCIQKGEYPASLLMDRSKKQYRLKKILFSGVKNLTVVPVSHWLEDLVRQSFLQNFPIHVINNGIDINTFAPTANVAFTRSKYGIKDQFLLLGVANQWTISKGLKDFIALCNMLSDDPVIVLVGLNKRQIKNLPSKIIGVTRTESIKDLAELYSAADLFVNPTWEDTFPTTNIEALSCGTPVLTYRTGGSIESISSETGFVVNKGDIQGIYDAINVIRQKGKLFYSSKCRNRAVSLYNKEDRFSEYISLYTTLGYKLRYQIIEISN
jgi:glycosyltransferase involved in cell wall biosynthesis